MAFGTACIVIGAMINANIFGNMAVLLQGLNRKIAQFQEKLDTANTAMKNMKISEQLQEKVQNYIMSTESTLSIQMELQAFLNLLSPSLRYTKSSTITIDLKYCSTYSSHQLKQISCSKATMTLLR